MLVAAVHKWRLNKIFVAAEADNAIVFQVLVYSKPVLLIRLMEFSLSRVKISSKKSCDLVRFEPEIFEPPEKKFSDKILLFYKKYCY